MQSNVIPAKDSFVREILLCDSVLKCENDTLIAIPLPRAVKSNEQVCFEALYLSLDTQVVLPANVINNKPSGLLNSFCGGLFICQVTKYVTQNDVPYAVVSIHCNQTIAYKSESENNRREAVFAFRYWIAKVTT